MEFKFLKMITAILTTLPILCQSKILIPESKSTPKEFDKFISSSEYISYSQYQLNLIQTKEDSENDFLHLSEYWLKTEFEYLEVNSTLRKLQKESHFSAYDRKLLFSIFDKKLSQNLNSESQKYYVSQLCWLYSNDSQLRYDYRQFEDYCKLKKISYKEILKMFPEYKILISDGNIHYLNESKSLSYNEVPQNLTLLSDKMEKINYFGEVDKLLKSSIKSTDYLVKGKCENFTSSALADSDDYDIYFNSSCIQNYKPTSLFSKVSGFIQDNKYEIISGIIIIGATYYFLKDKHLKMEDTNSDFQSAKYFNQWSF